MNTHTVTNFGQKFQIEDSVVLATALPASVAGLNLQRLKHKYTATSEAEMSEEEWDAGEREYRCFLALKQQYPAVSLVPSKLVDKIWHAHILDTRAYREDCERIFGHFIDHYPYFGIYGEDDYKNLQESFATTVRLYEQHYGAYPKDDSAIASRCQDHACHAPSECACRTPGACK